MIVDSKYVFSLVVVYMIVIEIVMILVTVGYLFYPDKALRIQNLARTYQDN